MVDRSGGAMRCFHCGAVYPEAQTDMAPPVVASGDSVQVFCACGEVWRPTPERFPRCPNCYTGYPLQPTNRPPILAQFPDGVERIYCPCGQVLLRRPNMEPLRVCPSCRKSYRWPGDPVPQQRLSMGAAPQPAKIVYFDPDEPNGGRVPVINVTDIDCFACGHTMGRVRHKEAYADLRPYVEMRCQRCGGQPVRGETMTYFAFIGMTEGERPDDRAFGWSA
jgi:hypothetical protein